MQNDVVLPFPVYGLAWKGNKVLVGGGGGTVKSGISNGLVSYLVDGTRLEELHRVQPPDSVFNLTFLSSNEVACGVGNHCYIYFLNSDGQRFRSDFHDSEEETQQVQCRVAVLRMTPTASDGCVRATPFGTMDSTVVHEGKAEINDVAGHPSQKKFACVTNSAMFIVEDRKAEQVATADPSFSFRSCIFSGDGRWLFGMQRSRDATVICVYDTATWKCVTRRKVCSSPSARMAYSSASWLVAVGTVARVIVYQCNPQTGELSYVTSVPAPSDNPVTALTFSSSGWRIIFAVMDIVRVTTITPNCMATRLCVLLALIVLFAAVIVRI